MAPDFPTPTSLGSFSLYSSPSLYRNSIGYSAIMRSNISLISSEPVPWCAMMSELRPTRCTSCNHAMYSCDVVEPPHWRAFSRMIRIGFPRLRYFSSFLTNLRCGLVSLKRQSVPPPFRLIYTKQAAQKAKSYRIRILVSCSSTF